MTLCYLFDFTIKKVGNINVTLGYLLLEVINKKLDKEEAQFDYFNKFYIRDFGNIWY